jgi:hypothetical protein
VNLVDLEKRLLVARPQDRPVIGAFCAVPVAPFAQYFIFSLNFDADQSDLSNS